MPSKFTQFVSQWSPEVQNVLENSKWTQTYLKKINFFKSSKAIVRRQNLMIHLKDSRSIKLAIY